MQRYIDRWIDIEIQVVYVCIHASSYTYYIEELPLYLSPECLSIKGPNYAHREPRGPPGRGKDGRILSWVIGEGCYVLSWFIMWLREKKKSW